MLPKATAADAHTLLDLVNPDVLRHVPLEDVAEGVTVAVAALREIVADPKTDATTRGKAKALLNSPRVLALIKRLGV